MYVQNKNTRGPLLRVTVFHKDYIWKLEGSKSGLWGGRLLESSCCLSDPLKFVILTYFILRSCDHTS